MDLSFAHFFEQMSGNPLLSIAVLLTLCVYMSNGQALPSDIQIPVWLMVVCSVVMAISEISEASTLGRVSAKTIGWFMMTSCIALLVAGTIAMGFYKAGLFNVHIEGVAASTGSTRLPPSSCLWA